MPVPYMQFQKHNPVDTALSAALKTYGGIQQGKSNQAQTNMLNTQLPYESDRLRLALEKQNLENQNYPQRQQAEIRSLNSGADINELNAQITAAKAPGEINKAKYESLKFQQDMKNLEKMYNMGLITQQQRDAYGEIEAAKMISQFGGGAPQNNPAQPQMPPKNVSENTSYYYNPQDYSNAANNPYQEPGMDPMGKLQEKYIPETVLAGRKKYSEAYAENQVKSFDASMQTLRENNRTNASMGASLDQMASQWDLIPNWNKGTQMVEVPALGGAAMSFQAAQSRILQDIMSRQKGPQTERDMEAFKQSLASRKMDDEGFYKTMALSKALIAREQEEQRFFNMNKGKDIDDVQTEWNDIISSKSVIDSPAYHQAMKPFYLKRKQELEAKKMSAGGAK